MIILNPFQRYNLLSKTKAKAIFLLTVFLVRIISVMAQSIPTKEYNKVLSYTPSGNGYVVKNMNIEYGIGIHEQGTRYAKLQWSVHAISEDVTGYKYNGTIYNNSSEIYNPVSTGNLEDAGASIKASFQIMYKGNVLKTVDNDIISATVNAFGTVEGIDPESNINDYSIANLRISSTSSPPVNRALGNAIREQKEKAAAKEKAKASGEEDTDTKNNTAKKSNEETAKKDQTEDAAQQSDTESEGFSYNSTKSSNNESSNAGNSYENSRESDRQQNYEQQRQQYEQSQQEHETKMNAIKGAQQGLHDAIEKSRQATREKYERKEAEERQRTSQEVQKAARLEQIRKEYRARHNNLQNIREEYFKWLRGQIIDDPFVDFVEPSVFFDNHIVDNQSLNENDEFHIALIEVRWRNFSDIDIDRYWLQYYDENKGYTTNGWFYDHSPNLRAAKNGDLDAVVRTDGETKRMVVNPVTRDNLTDIIRIFWKTAKEDKNSIGPGPYGNRIFIIASTSPEKLERFIERIQPVNVYGMKLNSSPNWDLWEKFEMAAGLYDKLLTASASEVNSSYSLLEKYKATYDNNLANVIKKGDTAFVQELLDHNIIDPYHRVNISESDLTLDLMSASIMLDNPEMVKFFLENNNRSSDTVINKIKKMMEDPVKAFTEENKRPPTSAEMDQINLFKSEYAKDPDHYIQLFLDKTGTSSTANSYLHYAIKNDKPLATEALMSSGAEISDDLIITAVKELYGEREAYYVEKFLNAGANPNTEPSVLTMNINEAATKLLIEAGADVSIASSALFNWVRKENYEMVKLLLDSGADPKVENLHGETPYDVASYQDNSSEMRKIKKALREAGGGGLNFHNVTKGLTYGFFIVGGIVIIAVLAQ